MFWGVSSFMAQSGCMDTTACNYDSLAMQEDGSCFYGTYFYLDVDHDGWGDEEDSLLLCSAQEGFSSLSGDCDVQDSAVYPGATEICNEIDDDCDGWFNEGVLFHLYYVDIDGDGYGQGQPDTTCYTVPSGYASQTGDCDETNVSFHPGAVETFNGLDEDCNGVIDDVYMDTDSDGVEDLLDEDDDNDGLLDSQEGDYNGDGVPNDDCDGDDIPNIRDLDPCDIFIPEVFTPNGDGINDVLEIGRLPFNAVVKLEIFNRWGALMYANDQYKNDWNGNNIDGGGLPAGNYPMVLTLNGNQVFQKNLTIWR